MYDVSAGVKAGFNSRLREEATSPARINLSNPPFQLTPP